MNINSMITATAIATVIGFAAAAPAGSALADQIFMWHAAASSGTVDEKDQHIVKFSGATAAIKNEKRRAKLNLRYNAVFEDTSTNEQYFFFVRWRDDGDQSRVRIKLKDYNLLTGEVSTIYEFDSNDHDQSDEFQFIALEEVDAEFDLGVLGHVYFVEASIQKKSRDAKPALAGIGIFTQGEDA